MKKYIKELKDEWTGLFSGPRYIYSKHNIKYKIKRLGFELNKELKNTLGHFLYTPLSLFVIVLGVVSAIMLSQYVTVSGSLDILEILSGFIIGFISLLIAAAIFVSTVHRQSSTRSSDNNAEFLSQITGNNGTLAEIYTQYQGFAKDDEKLLIFKATSTDWILDGSEYEEYKQWHSDNVASIEPLQLEPHDMYIKYPYNMAISAGWSRAYTMLKAYSAAKNVLRRVPYNTDTLKATVEKMLSAAKKNQEAGYGGIYIPTEFVGMRLYRIIFYSLTSLALICLAIFASQYKGNFVVTVDFEMTSKFIFLATLFAVVSLYLVLRYIMMFIGFLHNSTSYAVYSMNSLYIYEPDSLMKEPNTN